MNKKTLNIGILAHVNAGKTTITEQLLFQSGAIKAPGNVDKGSTITDYLDLEKQRGITIQNTCVKFEWDDVVINIIDTPGHADFSSEVDKALQVLDGIVLVISAVDGIQANTLNLWESLNELKIPVIIFINKIDRAGADPTGVFKELEKELNIKGFCVNYPKDESSLSPFSKMDTTEECIAKSYENLAELDDAIFELFLEDALVYTPEIEKKQQEFIASQQLIAIHFGIAKLGIGIRDLANSICNIAPMSFLNSDAINAKVFKIEHHKKYGKLAFIRMYSGSLKAKDVIYVPRLERTLKVNQLMQSATGKLESISEITCNEIGIIAVSEAIITGDVLGNELKNDSDINKNKSVLSVQIDAVNEKDYQDLSKALQQLDIENPALNFVWNKVDKEFYVAILGPMHSEVLQHSLAHRFQIEVTINPPKIIYKETPLTTAEGYVRYWMPKPCWAIMTFKISPGIPNSGVVFKSSVGVNQISQKYQNEVKRAIPWGLKQGIKGWEVTDIIIELIQGEEHNVHSNPGDFLLATPMGILRGIENADTQLLEPYFNFEIKAHQDVLGPLQSSLVKMNAQIDAPYFEGEIFHLKGTVTVATAIEYHIIFNTITGGKGRLKLNIGGYQPCEMTDDKFQKHIGVNPLDEAQWILHNRGAFKADERMR